MKKLFLSRITLFAGVGLVVLSASAQSLPPGTAAYSPGAADDEISWKTFISVVKPAPQTTPAWPKGALTFETWATDHDTYQTTPPHWPSASSPPTVRFQQGALGLHSRGGLKTKRQGDTSTNGLPPSVTCVSPGNAIAGNFPTPAATAPPANCAAEEVRRNKLAFDYIAGIYQPPGTPPPGLSPPLYTSSQLKTNFGVNTPVNFPQGKTKGDITNAALELKVDWVPVDTVVVWLNQNKQNPAVPKPVTKQFVLQNYFITKQADGTQYALLSMHLSLKDRPNWLWSTFEHQLNVGRCDTMGCYDKYGMPSGLAAIAPNAQSNQPYPVCSTKSPALKNLLKTAGLGPEWNNYCLKSTQTEFTVASGTNLGASKPANKTGAPPPLLGAPLSVLSGDSVVERIVADVPIVTSSCITCHSYAAFDKNGCISQANPGLQPGAGPIGAYKPQAGQKQYDFVWGFITMSTGCSGP